MSVVLRLKSVGFGVKRLEIQRKSRLTSLQSGIPQK
jgi:hypothetical protein